MDRVMLTRRTLVGATAYLAASALVRAEQKPIRIGEINSPSAIPAFTLPYRHGWRVATDKINAYGGVLARLSQEVGDDDGGK